MKDALFVVLGFGSSCAALALGAFGMYAVTIVVLALVRRPAHVPPGALGGSTLRMAALVVAHDEERVIEASVTSLRAQSHPSERLSVFVVADRCADRTAELAGNAGAQVLLRKDGAPGKTFAVAFGVNRVGSGENFDAIIVFDADNVVERDFVATVANRLAEGERAVQGTVNAKNPSASWVAAASALGFWGIAALVQAPRERLGLSTPPMGTGFAMRIEDATRFLAKTESLTDDLELSALLALAGVRVAYAPEARLEDEKPILLATAVRQRHRWMQGRFSVAGRYVPRLLARALSRDGTPLARFRLVDAAIQLVAPSLSFTAVALGALAGVELALRAAHPFVAVPPPEVVLVAAAALYVFPALAIARFRPTPFVWLCYVLSPAYLLLSAPLALSGILTRRSRVWERTEKG